LADDRPFYSFIGHRDLEKAASILLEQCEKEGLEPTLELVPEAVAATLKSKGFHFEEDMDETDYVLSVEQLQSYSGAKYAAKRTDVRKFLRCAENHRVELLDLTERETIRKIKNLFEYWHRDRQESGRARRSQEFRAFERCLTTASLLEFVGLGVFIKQDLVAFSISEVVGPSYACTYFEKADTAGFPGIGAFLNQQVARALAQHGAKFINIEQDLGIAGLRQSKASYGPVDYLQKYIVRGCGATARSWRDRSEPLAYQPDLSASVL
jgi:hypothetical protein